MLIRNNVPVYKICWLNYAKGGMIGTFYEPECKEELVELCRSLYREGRKFDVIGHTSNIYFLPNYNVGIMVSTRKVKNLEIQDDCIIADCGVSVSKLAHQMVNAGIKGFEGLIDLPGTVAASVYGNSSCYGCSVNDLLLSFDLLTPEGHVLTMSPMDLKLSNRSSVLKRGELGGVILSLKLRKEKGDAVALKKIADRNRQNRKATQPGPKDNLGSIYADIHVYSFFSYIVRGLAKILALPYFLTGKGKNEIKPKQRRILFTLLGAKDLLPYVHSWNRYIWKDEHSHKLFWKYHKIHQRLFKPIKFEIEIRGKAPT